MNGNSNNKLSLVASAIWRFRTQEPDPYDCYGHDCGPLIAKGNRAYVLRIISEGGYQKPGDYNEDLRSRMVTDGHVSLRVSALLGILAVEDVCPKCGAALDVKTHYTRNYGGGYDTFESCPECDYKEAYV